MFQPFQVNQQLIPLLWFVPSRVRRIGVREELQKIGTEFGGDSREILLRKPFEQLGADVVVHEIASRRGFLHPYLNFYLGRLEQRYSSELKEACNDQRQH